MENWLGYLCCAWLLSLRGLIFAIFVKSILLVNCVEQGRILKFFEFSSFLFLFLVFLSLCLGSLSFIFSHVAVIRFCFLLHRLGITYSGILFSKRLINLILCQFLIVGGLLFFLLQFLRFLFGLLNLARRHALVGVFRFLLLCRLFEISLLGVFKRFGVRLFLFQGRCRIFRGQLLYGGGLLFPVLL